MTRFERELEKRAPELMAADLTRDSHRKIRKVIDKTIDLSEKCVIINTDGYSNTIAAYYQRKDRRLRMRLDSVDDPEEKLVLKRAIIINTSRIERLDGGRGSGNFGHAGRPGKVGGSTKTASSLNEQVAAACKTGDKGEVTKAVHSALNDSAKASSISLTVGKKTLRLIKMGDNEWRYVDGGTVH